MRRPCCTSACLRITTHAHHLQSATGVQTLLLTSLRRGSAHRRGKGRGAHRRQELGRSCFPGSPRSLAPQPFALRVSHWTCHLRVLTEDHGAVGVAVPKYATRHGEMSSSHHRHFDLPFPSPWRIKCIVQAGFFHFKGPELRVVKERGGQTRCTQRLGSTFMKLVSLCKELPRSCAK